MKEFSDNEIVECLRKRQSYVVKYLSARYLPMIKLLIFQNGGSIEEAKDIFQDGLIIILEKIDEGNFKLTCKFKTYLYCICENIMHSNFNKKKTAKKYILSNKVDSTEKDISESMDQILYEKIFMDVFESMDQVSKTILNLYWQNISPVKIAEKLDYSYGYVRKKKHDAQNELIERVKNHPAYRRIIISDNAVKKIVK